jgi:VanZ family protein
MFFRYNFFPICWALVMLLLTLTPGENMPETSLWDNLLSFDKIAHLFMFAVLVFLMIVGLNKQYKYRFLRDKALQISVIAGISYGIVIEIVQLFIPGRGFELADIFANTIGCFIGFGLFYLIYKF